MKVGNNTVKGRVRSPFILHPSSFLICFFLLTSCASPRLAHSNPGLTPSVVPTSSPTLTSLPIFTPTLLPTATGTPTPLPTRTPFPSPTATPPPTATPTWVFVGPGEVTVPILLYHHIAESPTGSRYYVSPAIFRQQMQQLRDWGYQTITAAELVGVILYGGSLPARPVVITFDDGDLDVFQNAFPILQDLGFRASFYIVSSYLDADGFISTLQLQQMAQAGWEIGSHSMTHSDLTTDYSRLRSELVESKQNIQSALGMPVTTFAYPFGKVDPFVLKKTSEYGYLAGLGLGVSVIHNQYSLFYLSRKEVQSDYDMAAFAALVPWH